MKCLRNEVIQLKGKYCHVTIADMGDRKVSIKLFANASFVNVEGGKMQTGLYIWLSDGRGNQCSIIWKSKVARKVIDYTLAAEVATMVEAVEWAEYIKFLWEEIVD